VYIYEYLALCFVHSFNTHTTDFISLFAAKIVSFIFMRNTHDNDSIFQPFFILRFPLKIMLQLTRFYSFKFCSFLLII
jgi:hypothetical protein